MRSQEFIAEENLWDDDDEIEQKIRHIQEVAKLSGEEISTALAIRDKCQPYLEQNISPALWTPLFRGLGKSMSDETVQKRVRLDNRTPADMPSYLHQYINEYFVDYHGAPFRNAMFCTGSSVEASGYGNEYIIFPIGHFEYCWSPKIDDLWTAYDSFTTDSGVNLDSGTDVYDEFMDQVVYNGEWKTTDLKGAIDSKHEIMVRCKQYYGFAYNEMEDGTKWKAIEAIIKL